MPSSGVCLSCPVLMSLSGCMCLMYASNWECCLALGPTYPTCLACSGGGGGMRTCALRRCLGLSGLSVHAR